MTMTKPDQKIQLRKEIKQLEESRYKMFNYLINNIDAFNYDEIARDKRAVDVKIETKNRQLNGVSSQKGENYVQSNVTLPFSHAH